MKILFALALAALAAGGQTPPTVYQPGGGVSLPQVIRQVKAQYTAEAKANRIEGDVKLGATVLADGTVSDVQVTESLDSIYGLDKNAIDSLKQWEFKPGTKDGKPVAVRVSVAITFTLK